MFDFGFSWSGDLVEHRHFHFLILFGITIRRLLYRPDGKKKINSWEAASEEKNWLSRTRTILVFEVHFRRPVLSFVLKLRRCFWKSFFNFFLLSSSKSSLFCSHFAKSFQITNNVRPSRSFSHTIVAIRSPHWSFSGFYIVFVPALVVAIVGWPTWPPCRKLPTTSGVHSGHVPA